MNSKHFRHLKEIFQTALQQDPEDRADFLDKACHGDDDLRRKVEKLLATDEDSNDFLEVPVITSLPPTQSVPCGVGTWIGRYRIVSIISSGGMGTVYKAVQEHPERVVAIKVMKPLLSKTALRRFEYEVQILAMLNHPNIAHVIEAGTHGAGDDGEIQDRPGLPYFVMEYIPEARSITDYAHEKKLTVRERLGLFEQICDAVHHGHQKGIIHRDLKPSNVLVEPSGRVMIIDFGIARALETDIALTTMLTEAGHVVGTLQYMSPEQCEADPHNLDNRSDVYALGVVLYELLCGELPYDVRKSTLIEAVKLIRDEPPKRPSEIKRLLRGDVETIVLKALEKNRAHRYQTVLDFGSDIRRFLKGEVILAKPAGSVRRIWKWIKRNPKVSAAVGMAALAVTAFTVYVLLWSYPEIKAEKEKAERAEKEAVEARKDAEEQSRILRERSEEITRLSDVKWLSDLEEEAERLWPPYPDKIVGLESWVHQADELLHRLDLHERRLKALRETAMSCNDEESSPPAWRFADHAMQWQHDTLADLVSGLTALADEETGASPSVRSRLAFARTIAVKSIHAHREEWDYAMASISDPAVCPRYNGLEIEPQIGLVPIAQDPKSGLWEFAHLLSGDVPVRGKDGKLELTEETGLVFVLLPGGTFQMGAEKPLPEKPMGTPNIDPGAGQIEGPVHTVRIDPFFLSKYEMTQGQWLRITRDIPSPYKPGSNFDGYIFTWLHPVESVSWEDCVQVLFRMNLRLPSESEWEYAARAGTTTIWWTGNDKKSLEGSINMCDLFSKEHGLWPELTFEEWLDDGYTVHAPVGNYLSNAFGLHDVSGNVCEWCRDSLAAYTLDRTDGSAFETTHARPRVHRGGGFGSHAWYCRSASRFGAGPGFRAEFLGVRPAHTLF